MKRRIVVGLLLIFYHASVAQTFDKQREERSPNYIQVKSAVVKKLNKVSPGRFGDFVPGIMTKMISKKKIVAFTFDACGGPTGSGFDTLLIAYLKREKIPATLFISGSWIEKNDSLFRQLCQEPLFEIENHGLSHRPCSITPKSKYGITGTGSINEAIDEIELNARQIEFYSKMKPKFYRPAAAAADEGCVSIANELNEKIITYDVLSADAVRGTSATVIELNILNKTKPGSIVIMHMNHPERNGFEALVNAVPKLKREGYEFVKLEDHPLAGKK